MSHLAGPAAAAGERQQPLIAAEPAARNSMMAYFRLLRPQQWVKNLFVFAGLVFGGKFLDPASLLLALGGFACLCLVSSHVYIFNDIHDRAEDRLHPRKSKRPIAAGAVSVAAGATLAVLLLIGGLAASLWLDRRFFIAVLAYLVLQVAYTWSFKHAAVLDVIAIATGFVIRAIAGAELVHVDISPWLVVCTFTLCLFLGFGKRRCELQALEDGNQNTAGRHRRTLSIYTRDLLNHMTTVTAGVAIVCFILYATDSRTANVYGVAKAEYLLYTLPIVVYCIFRVAVLVEHGRIDGPTDVIIRDRPFQLALLAWTIAAVAIVYGEKLRALFG
jgi:4-hydroxybenzoate polyprenyltransferase